MAQGTSSFAVSGRQVGPALHHKQAVVRVAFSPSGGELATASLDRTAQLWDFASGQSMLPRPLRHTGPVRDVVFAPDGALIGKIKVPEVVANVCFGGPKRDRLYICGTTSLYAIYVNAQGAIRPR